MITVKETFRIKGNTTVLVCDVFEDSEITKTIQSNAGTHVSFEVLPVRNCFSEATTRNIILFDNKENTNIEEITFI